jgi:hypothetical protein
MSANASSEVVARCAAAVLRDYLLHYVTSDDIAAATTSDATGRAWLSLTFVAYLQQEEFGTRTGGERKRLSYGDQLSQARAAKADAATALKELSATFPRKSEVSDTCEIYYRNQIW